MTRISDTRIGISWPNATLRDEPADVPGDLLQLATGLQLMALCDQGTHAGRPAAGKGRKFYYETDTATLFYDTGSAWVSVSVNGNNSGILSARPTATALLNGLSYFATDQVASYLVVSGAWVRTSTDAGVTSICLQATADAGNILLQGQAWPATTGIYADVFAKFGGSNLPDFGTFAPVGWKTADGSFGTLLGTVGEKTHLLTIPEMPAHHHEMQGQSSGSGGFPGAQVGTGINTSDVGGGGAHNNIQPSKAVNFQAKL